MPVGVSKADGVVSLDDLPSVEVANQAILMMDRFLAHVASKPAKRAGSRKVRLYRLSPVDVARRWKESLDTEAKYFLETLDHAGHDLDPKVRAWILETPLGPKQPVLIRAALRRVVQDEIDTGRLDVTDATTRYKEAIANQKLLFFVSQNSDVNTLHDQALRERFSFFGFSPDNIVTIEQEVARGLTVNADGRVSFVDEPYGADAAGHLYALIQAARTTGFTTCCYTPSGRAIKPMGLDAFSYVISRGIAPNI